eukprot:Awhi_evm1s3824
MLIYLVLNLLVLHILLLPVFDHSHNTNNKSSTRGITINDPNKRGALSSSSFGLLETFSLSPSSFTGDMFSFSNQNGLQETNKKQQQQQHQQPLMQRYDTRASHHRSQSFGMDGDMNYMNRNGNSANLNSHVNINPRVDENSNHLRKSVSLQSDMNLGKVYTNLNNFNTDHNHRYNNDNNNNNINNINNYNNLNMSINDINNNFSSISLNPTPKKDLQQKSRLYRNKSEIFIHQKGYPYPNSNHINNGNSSHSNNCNNNNYDNNNNNNFNRIRIMA